MVVRFNMHVLLVISFFFLTNSNSKIIKKLIKEERLKTASLSDLYKDEKIIELHDLFENISTVYRLQDLIKTLDVYIIDSAELEWMKNKMVRSRYMVRSSAECEWCEKKNKMIRSSSFAGGRNGVML